MTIFLKPGERPDPNKRLIRLTKGEPMLRFRKKPVVIEAFQMTKERRASNDDWPGWMHFAWNMERGEVGSLHPTNINEVGGTLSIRTLEGEHLVSWDDWIIQGIAGELYPCKPDIFQATYEPADKPGPLRKALESVGVLKKEDGWWVVFRAGEKGAMIKLPGELGPIVTTTIRSWLEIREEALGEAMVDKGDMVNAGL